VTLSCRKQGDEITSPIVSPAPIFVSFCHFHCVLLFRSFCHFYMRTEIGKVLSSVTNARTPALCVTWSRPMRSFTRAQIRANRICQVKSHSSDQISIENHLCREYKPRKGAGLRYPSVICAGLKSSYSLNLAVRDGKIPFDINPSDDSMDSHSPVDLSRSTSERYFTLFTLLNLPSTWPHYPFEGSWETNRSGFNKTSLKSTNDC
jgi:hypothetical protein